MRVKNSGRGYEKDSQNPSSVGVWTRRKKILRVAGPTKQIMLGWYHRLLGGATSGGHGMGGSGFSISERDNVWGESCSYPGGGKKQIFPQERFPESLLCQGMDEDTRV